jgi:hypothetical protein
VRAVSTSTVLCRYCRSASTSTSYPSHPHVDTATAIDERVGIEGGESSTRMHAHDTIGGHRDAHTRPYHAVNTTDRHDHLRALTLRPRQLRFRARSGPGASVLLHSRIGCLSMLILSTFSPSRSCLLSAGVLCSWCWSSVISTYRIDAKTYPRRSNNYSSVTECRTGEQSAAWRGWICEQDRPANRLTLTPFMFFLTVVSCVLALPSHRAAYEGESGVVHG